MKDKLRNTQLNKLKFAVKNLSGATLLITRKNFQDEKLQHELQRQDEKLKQEIPLLNMLADIKRSKAQYLKQLNQVDLV